ncbi:MAG: alpha/beta hydrolase-fold protein [Chloroflexi bacterium]|nr:alpha/beta hydrolase-fold protein [Chloroflexota bacterium]
MTDEVVSHRTVHAVYHSGDAGPLPTLVAIHGHGANGFDLLGLAPYLAGGRLLILCPQAEFVLQPGALSYTWFDAQAGERPGQRSPEEFERVAGTLQAFVDVAVPRYGGDPQRTALLGFSQGGTLAYRLGLGAPGRYRGVAALSTWMPPEAEEQADRDAAVALPLLIQHGTEDQLVTVDRARDSRDRLVAMGLAPDYREYSMAHEIRPSSLGDLTQWLERVLNLPAASRP